MSYGNGWCFICGAVARKYGNGTWAKTCTNANCQYELKRIRSRQAGAQKGQETPARRAALVDLDKVCEELVAAEQGEPAPPVEPMGAEQAIRDAVHAEHAKENLRLLNENASLRAEIERLKSRLRAADA